MKKNIDDNSLEELKFLLQFTIEVIDSNENDIDKALILYKFYKSPEDFNKLFLPFKIKLENKYPDLGFRIDEIDEILRNFKSNQIIEK